MRRKNRWLLSLFLIVLVTSARGVTIDGVVRDREGNGLPETAIEVYAMVGGDLRVIGRTKSKEEDAKAGTSRGYYRVSVPDGTVISAISYDNDAWQPRVIKDVSDKAGDDQKINKVLLDKQGPAKFRLILQQIHEYEELYYLEQERAGASAAEVQRKVRAKFEERILSMPDPRRVREQPAKQQRIVREMSPQQQRVLAKKMEELFSLYGIVELPQMVFSHITQVGNAGRFRLDRRAGTADYVFNGVRHRDNLVFARLEVVQGARGVVYQVERGGHRVDLWFLFGRTPIQVVGGTSLYPMYYSQQPDYAESKKTWVRILTPKGTSGVPLDPEGP